MARHNPEQLSRSSSRRQNSRCRHCSDDQKQKVHQDAGKDNDDHSCPARHCPVVGPEYFSEDNDAKNATAPGMSREWSNPIPDPRGPFTWQTRQDSNGQWQYMCSNINTTPSPPPGTYPAGSGYYTPPTYPYTMNAAPTPPYSPAAGYSGSYNNTRAYGPYLSPMLQQFSPYTPGVQYAIPTVPNHYYNQGNQNNAGIGNGPSIQIDPCSEDQAGNDDNYDDQDGEDQAQAAAPMMRKSHSSSSHRDRRNNHHHHRHDHHYDSDNGHDRHHRRHHRHRD